MSETAVVESSEKIGSTPHRRRNLWIFAAVVAAVFMAIVYSGLMARQNAQLGTRLDAFMAAYTMRCGASGLAVPTPPAVRALYLDSSALQEVIDSQAVALKGGADCESVRKALHVAQFPMAPPKSAEAAVAP